MSSLLPSHPDTHRWQAGDEVVHRTIRGDWPSIKSVLTDPASLSGLPIHVDQSFERVDRLVVEVWRANIRIERAGRTERIEVEVTQASSWSAELRVLPWKQRRYRSGRRRQQLLTELADQLEVLLTDTTRAPIDLTERTGASIDLTEEAVATRPMSPKIGFLTD
jgi:hypothetical protein